MALEIQQDINTISTEGAIPRGRDIRAIKSALNKLGFYYPKLDEGITETTSKNFYDAIKTFQIVQGIY